MRLNEITQRFIPRGKRADHSEEHIREETASTGTEKN